MVYVKPFRGIRPESNEMAEKVSALPYDVMNRKEAKAMAEGNDHSILHITRAEIDFPEDIGDYDDCVYRKAKSNFDEFCANGTLKQEAKPVYYIYREIMNSNVQTGIVAVVAVCDYENGKVMKHELTRKEKEADRIRHFDVCNCQTEPVFLAYRHNDTIDQVVAEWIENNAPEYDFTADDDVRHILWVIDDDPKISIIENEFADLNKVYIADGHHRTASAAAIGKLRKEQGLISDENDPANFVMAVIFPDHELEIMAYNRIVNKPENFDGQAFLESLKELFTVEKIEGDFLPAEKHTFGLYLDDSWYSLKSNESLYTNDDIIENLDAAILQKNVLAPYFGIEDPRTDKRIDFIGGIRGNKEIIRRSIEENSIGFNLYPVEISDLMAVADAGKLMPPKSTWFEPKLRSGLFLHSLNKK